MPSVTKNKTKGSAYWRSLDELAGSPEFQQKLASEFAGYNPEDVIASPTRRAMLKLMGASMALGGAGAMTGCRRWPEKQLAPFTERPEGRVPGVPVRYATSFELGGYAAPLLVSSYDGRPMKIEGNPEHPISGGAASSIAQASILEMYDPERSRRPLGWSQDAGELKPTRWANVSQALAGAAAGEGFAVLCEATGSPTMQRLRQELGPDRWYEYESISFDNEVAGASQAFGRPLRSLLHLDKAQVIAAFDADILWGHPASLMYARQFMAGRGVDAENMSRMYVAEPTVTVTGTNADRRQPVRRSQIGAMVAALASLLGVEGAEAGVPEDPFLAHLAEDLKRTAGRSVVTAGPAQPPAVHAMVAAINAHLGNLGKAVSYLPESKRPSHMQSLAKLVEKIEAGEIKSLLILGGNPAYDAPADIPFAKALASLGQSFHLSRYVDETSAVCKWHLPRSHYLEAWGDGMAWDGTVMTVQPLILPLFDTRSAIEVVAMALGRKESGHELVRQTFAKWIGDDVFERGWRKALHRGFLADSAPKAVTPSLQGRAFAQDAATAESDGLELTFTPDYSVYDGRFANNGWLQELPDPVTKLVWDNAALMNLGDAKKLGLQHGDMVRLSAGDLRLELPVFLLPGQARGCVTVSLGYGRSKAGYIGDEVGFDAYQARSSTALYVMPVDKPAKLARRYELVTTQDHYAIDQLGIDEREERAERWLVRSRSKPFYQEHPEFAKHMGIHAPTAINEQGRKVTLQIFEPPHDYENVHRWGMAIDLSKCIGCSACMVACQAENNVPIVGKHEVSRNREMHWLRIDRYYNGDPESPDIVHQPVTCHHCETAPCEQVCPVAATVHDSEGLNVMIYNRCVGTRYCSNNCPYKVRRFNYFDWHYKPVKSSEFGGTFLGPPDMQLSKGVDSVRRLGMNPEVTVRMRGVMEKCTFCVQRIKSQTIPALNAYRRGERSTPFVDEGAVTPACAQTCPTDAIIFGDLNNAQSAVARAFDHNRAYEMLEDLNVRARTRYLARITNPGHGLGNDEPVPGMHGHSDEGHYAESDHEHSEPHGEEAPH